MKRTLSVEAVTRSWGEVEVAVEARLLSAEPGFSAQVAFDVVAVEDSDDELDANEAGVVAEATDFFDSEDGQQRLLDAIAADEECRELAAAERRYERISCR